MQTKIIKPIIEARESLRITRNRLRYVDIDIPIIDIINNVKHFSNLSKDFIKSTYIKVNGNFKRYLLLFTSKGELELCKHNHWELIYVIKGTIVENVRDIKIHENEYLLIPPYVTHHILVNIKNSSFYIDFATEKKFLTLPTTKKIHILGNNKDN